MLTTFITCIEIFLGEYVLVRADSPRVKLDVQGRFEQVRNKMIIFQLGQHFLIQNYDTLLKQVNFTD